MMRRLFLIAGLLIALSAAGAYGAGFIGPHGGGTGGAAQTITDIQLSNATFTAGSPSGTIVGTISTIIVPGSFSGSYSLSGADAASFQIVSSNQLATLGILSNPTYHLNIVSTQAGAIGSPFI